MNNLYKTIKIFLLLVKLNYRLHISKNISKTIPIIMIHGLFGDLNNLKTIAMHLAQYYNIIQVDLCNHGNSPHSNIMTYTTMAQDILNILNYLSIKTCFVIGHSIGGKVAMNLGITASKRVKKIIVIDIAPIIYNSKNNNHIFQMIKYINRLQIQNKNDVIDIMQNNNIKKNTILFLLKSFNKGIWNFNFNFIEKNYKIISGWDINEKWWGPILFIKGELSFYINKIGIQSIYKQFPKAYIHNVPNAGHWVHYEYPIDVFNIIKNFL